MRLVAGYGAIASALPYLALKVVWLSGGTLGVADQRMMADASMVALNALTAGMDLAGVGLALAFTHRWGMRLPAWLLLPPLWVATGLLATFVVLVPVAAILAAVASDTLPRVAGGPVEGWVYVLVHVEFAGMGIGLTVAFVLYARARWPEAFEPAKQTVPPGGAHDVQVWLTNAAGLAAIALGTLYLAWALGAAIGLPAHALAQRTVIGAVFNGTAAVLMFAAAAGTVTLVRRWGGKVPAWVPPALAWIGTGSMFGWGLWQTLNALGRTALVRAEGMAFVNLAGLLRLVAGLVLGLVLAFALAERHAPASAP